MKSILPILLLLAACAPVERTSMPDRPGKVSISEILIAGKPSIDPLLLKTGQWILLSVGATGDPQNYITKIQVTAQDDRGTWIEQRVPTEIRPIIYKSRIAKDGSLVEGWVGEPRTTTPTKIYPRDGAAPAPAPSTSPGTRAEASRETITVRGKTYDCCKLVTVIPHADGRSTTITEWCNAAVPFSAMHDGKPVGGLVKREFDRYRVELLDFGDGAVEELLLPK